MGSGGMGRLAWPGSAVEAGLWVMKVIGLCL